MTHESNDTSLDDYYAEQAAAEEAADRSYEEALRALSDKSSDPLHPNFDAGIATERAAYIDKFGIDPEQP